jgi:hypothetical protein
MVAIGTKVPGRTHPTFVNEANGCSVVVAGVAVVAWDVMESLVYYGIILIATKSEKMWPSGLL